MRAIKALLGRLSMKIRDFVFGLQSNIPLCCVWGFINGSAYWIPGGAKPHYLVCKKCKKNKTYNDLKICDYVPVKWLFGFDNFWNKRIECNLCGYEGLAWMTDLSGNCKRNCGGGAEYARRY